MKKLLAVFALIVSQSACAPIANECTGRTAIEIEVTAQKLRVTFDGEVYDECAGETEGNSILERTATSVVVGYEYIGASPWPYDLKVEDMSDCSGEPVVLHDVTDAAIPEEAVYAEGGGCASADIPLDLN